MYNINNNEKSQLCRDLVLGKIRSLQCVSINVHEERVWWSRGLFFEEDVLFENTRTFETYKRHRSYSCDCNIKR